MSLIQIVISLVVVGVVMWLINTYIPMQSGVKKVMNIVVVIAVILYVLMAFGVIGSAGGISVR